jgi:hypothetical protein
MQAEKIWLTRFFLWIDGDATVDLDWLSIAEKRSSRKVVAQC